MTSDWQNRKKMFAIQVPFFLRNISKFHNVDLFTLFLSFRFHWPFNSFGLEFPTVYLICPIRDKIRDKISFSKFWSLVAMKVSSQYLPESLKDTPSASFPLTLRNDALLSRVQNERGSLTCNSFRVFGPTLICPETSELGLKGRDFWNVRKNGSTQEIEAK